MDHRSKAKGCIPAQQIDTKARCNKRQLIVILNINNIKKGKQPNGSCSHDY